MIRQWLRANRASLIALPVAIALGFAWPAYQGWDYGNYRPTEVHDIGKGEVAHYAGGDFKLKRLSIEPRKPPDDPDAEPVGPKNSVVVIAVFRGRYQDKKTAKDIYCEFTVENSEGWEWESWSYGDLVSSYVSEDTPNQCSGETLNDDFEEVYPKPGHWFDFAVAFNVPKKRAEGLRPTLRFHEEFPDYLRFAT